MPILLGTTCLKYLVLWHSSHHTGRVTNSQPYRIRHHIITCMQVFIVVSRDSFSNTRPKKLVWILFTHIYTHRVCVYTIYLISVCIHIQRHVFIPTILSTTYMALFVQVYIPLLAHLCWENLLVASLGQFSRNADHISIFIPKLFFKNLPSFGKKYLFKNQFNPIT